jgi:hypothetical protein
MLFLISGSPPFISMKVVGGKVLVKLAITVGHSASVSSSKLVLVQIEHDWHWKLHRQVVIKLKNSGARV